MVTPHNSNTDTPENLPGHALDFTDGQLHFGTKSISDLATSAGRTPFYVYDRQRINQRIESLRDAFNEKIKLHYAIKANPMPALVQHLSQRVDGLDVASQHEALLALNTGMDPTRISFSGPGKTDQELAAAIASGIHIHAESVNEIKRVSRLATKAGKAPAVVLRINPDFELKRSGMQMGGGAKPFGIDAEQLPGVFSMMQENNVDFTGFHIFAGSQNLSALHLVECQNQTIDQLLQLNEHAPSKANVINLGGGFGIPYFKGETPLDVALVASNLLDRVDELLARTACDSVILELGRYLVGEAGYYICRVIDKKISRGKTYLVTDGGLHHNLAASGNLGQVIRKNYPVVAATSSGKGGTQKVSVVGPLCTPLDVIAENIELPAMAPGDFIAVLQSGAYGCSASPQQFLSHPPPLELLV